MIRFGKVHSAIWEDESFRSVSVEARLFYIYLLSSDNGNPIGIFKIGYGTMEDEYHEEDRTAMKSWMSELNKVGLIHYDPRSQWLYFNEFLKWNIPTSPNHARAMANFLNEIVKAEAPREAICQFLNKVKSILGAITYPKKDKDKTIKRSYYEDFMDSLNKQALADYLGSESNLNKCLQGMCIAFNKPSTSLNEAFHKPSTSLTKPSDTETDTEIDTDTVTVTETKTKTLQSFVSCTSNKKNTPEVKLLFADGQLGIVSAAAIRLAAIPGDLLEAIIVKVQAKAMTEPYQEPDTFFTTEAKQLYTSTTLGV